MRRAPPRFPGMGLVVTSRARQRDYWSRFISTRRFCARPAAVVFGPMKFVGPYPTAVNMLAGTPLLTRYAITASARWRDRRMFIGREPVDEV